MEVTTFASGSSGNCALVTTGETRLLIDAGISFLKIRQYLGMNGCTPEDIDGILITHEHSDHIRGLKTLLKRTDIPLFAPRTVASRLWGMLPESDGKLNPIPVETEITLGDLRFTAFPTPHDTPQSVGYRLEDGTHTFCLCTDLGHVTDVVLDYLTDADAVVIEANHDEEMLKLGPYPVPLKRRILSDNGHLSNHACARLAVTLAEHGTEQFVLGHISKENNTPRLAYDTVAEALNRSGHGDTYLAAAPAEGCLTIPVGRRTPCSR